MLEMILNRLSAAYLKDKRHLKVRSGNTETIIAFDESNKSYVVKGRLDRENGARVYLVDSFLVTVDKFKPFVWDIQGNPVRNMKAIYRTELYGDPLKLQLPEDLTAEKGDTIYFKATDITGDTKEFKEYKGIVEEVFTYFTGTKDYQVTVLDMNGRQARVWSYSIQLVIPASKPAGAKREAQKQDSPAGNQMLLLAKARARRVRVLALNESEPPVAPKPQQPKPSSSAVAAAEKAIAATKAKLIAQAKRKGLSETFGQKEVRMLEDKFSANPHGSPEQREIFSLIDRFRDWTMDYEN
jgi:hypothetical protein